MKTVDEEIAEVPGCRARPSSTSSTSPDASRRRSEDGMRYGMPALKVAGRPYVSVIAAAKHLSLFPFSPAAIDAVRAELAGYSLSKGTVRFSAERPLPDDVVERLLSARLAEIARRVDAHVRRRPLRGGTARLRAYSSRWR
ncbi:iron chaperone [Georgenia sp. AZ-5]|uniref:iron chaperone n=1 Tax=Georgenia sp. AZ-5 TaxID=3367526 RepID=UPI0037553576